MDLTFLTTRSRKWICVLSLISSVFCSAAQFVDVTVQLECNDWGYWFLQDQRSGSGRDTIFNEPATVHCIIGTNTWLMEGDFHVNAFVRRQFTGTNLIEETVVTRELSESESKRIAQVSKFAASSPPLSHKYSRTYDTSDGNPGRPVRVSDLMDLRGRICWLALCSGSAIQREGRQLFPPSDLWKELLSAPAGFAARTSVFEDGLGLPRSVELFTPENRCIFQYQVRQTTNILGWEIPLEFYGVQYRPARTNGWELQMTFKGKVTVIGVSSELKLPTTNEVKISR